MWQDSYKRPTHKLCKTQTELWIIVQLCVVLGMGPKKEVQMYGLNNEGRGSVKTNIKGLC